MSIIRSNNNIFDPFALDIWNPLEVLASALSAPHSDKAIDAQIDWKETPEAHIYKADLPGLKKEEVKVEVEEGRLLKISGERKRETEEKNVRWHRVERSSGEFLRQFSLPENINAEQVKASMENGVLTVIVPKAKAKKPEIKSIEVSEKAKKKNEEVALPLSRAGSVSVYRLKAATTKY